MEIIIKIIAIGLITSFATLIIKPIRSDFAIFTAIVGGLIIIFMIISYLSSIFGSLKNIVSFTGLNSDLYTLLHCVQYQKS